MRQRSRVCRRGLTIFALALLILSLSSCADETADGDKKSTDEGGFQREISLVYPDWSSERASAYLFQAFIQENSDCRVQLRQVDAEEMWSDLANGDVDFITGAWLPTTHRDYIQEYKEQVIDLGPNLSGAKIGILVPRTKSSRQSDSSGLKSTSLVSINSIEELEGKSRLFDGKIYGIEPGSGIAMRSRELLTEYGLDDQYRLLLRDEESMTKQLSEAVGNGRPIAITGWKPHWVFEFFDLEFLDDPKRVFGGEETIHTMVRTGFREEYPDIYQLLDAVSYSSEELERLMLWIEKDPENDPYAQALRWLNYHPDRVSSWLQY